MGGTDVDTIIIADKFCLLHVHENLLDLQVPFTVKGFKLLF